MMPHSTTAFAHTELPGSNYVTQTSPSITPDSVSINLLSSQLTERMFASLVHVRMSTWKSAISGTLRASDLFKLAICQQRKGGFIVSECILKVIQGHWPGKERTEMLPCFNFLLKYRKVWWRVMDAPSSAMSAVWKGNSACHSIILSLLTYPHLPSILPLSPHWPCSLLKPPPWLIQRLM